MTSIHRWWTDIADDQRPTSALFTSTRYSQLPTFTCISNSQPIQLPKQDHLKNHNLFNCHLRPFTPNNSKSRYNTFAFTYLSSSSISIKQARLHYGTLLNQLTRSTVYVNKTVYLTFIKDRFSRRLYVDLVYVWTCLPVDEFCRPRFCRRQFVKFLDFVKWLWRSNTIDLFLRHNSWNRKKLERPTSNSGTPLTCRLKGYAQLTDFKAKRPSQTPRLSVTHRL